MKNVRRVLVLEKGEHVYVFAYPPGQEDRLFEVLIEQARDPRIGFDWLDVAMLESKLKEMPHQAKQTSSSPQPKPHKPTMPNRFQQPCDGPLWFIRGLFG